jgi:hypothetical protein
VDIGDLTTSLDVEVGGVLEEPELQVLLINAVGTFNAYAPQQIMLAGTTFDRELTAGERRLLVLLAYATYLRGLHLQTTMAGIVHTNVAGRTDLTNIPKNVKELRALASEEILATIGALSGQMSGAGVQVHELGATLSGPGSTYFGWPRPYWYYR